MVALELTLDLMGISVRFLARRNFCPKQPVDDQLGHRVLR